jgi:uncharacterized membrane protein
MVLELQAPEEPGWAPLLRLWPVFFAYVLSFTYVCVYWANHHRLFHYATNVTNSLLWSNNLLLFTLSLVPFATAYLGEHAFSRDATILYMAVMLCPSATYAWLQSVIRRTGQQDAETLTYHRQTSRKGLAATIVYALGLPLTFITPALGLVCAALVAIFWFVPNSPFDRWFAR